MGLFKKNRIKSINDLEEGTFYKVDRSGVFSKIDKDAKGLLKKSKKATERPILPVKNTASVPKKHPVQPPTPKILKVPQKIKKLPKPEPIYVKVKPPIPQISVRVKEAKFLALTPIKETVSKPVPVHASVSVPLSLVLSTQSFRNPSSFTIHQPPKNAWKPIKPQKVRKKLQLKIELLNLRCMSILLVVIAFVSAVLYVLINNFYIAINQSNLKNTTYLNASSNKPSQSQILTSLLSQSSMLTTLMYETSNLEESVSTVSSTFSTNEREIYSSKIMEILNEITYESTIFTDSSTIYSSLISTLSQDNQNLIISTNHESIISNNKNNDESTLKSFTSSTQYDSLINSDSTFATNIIEESYYFTQNSKVSSAFTTNIETTSTSFELLNTETQLETNQINNSTFYLSDNFRNFSFTELNYLPLMINLDSAPTFNETSSFDNSTNLKLSSTVSIYEERISSEISTSNAKLFESNKSNKDEKPFIFSLEETSLVTTLDSNSWSKISNDQSTFSSNTDQSTTNETSDTFISLEETLTSISFKTNEKSEDISSNSILDSTTINLDTNSNVYEITLNINTTYENFSTVSFNHEEFSLIESNALSFSSDKLLPIEVESHQTFDKSFLSFEATPLFESNFNSLESSFYYYASTMPYHSTDVTQVSSYKVTFSEEGHAYQDSNLLLASDLSENLSSNLYEVTNEFLTVTTQNDISFIEEKTSSFIENYQTESFSSSLKENFDHESTSLSIQAIINDSITSFNSSEMLFTDLESIESFHSNSNNLTNTELILHSNLIESISINEEVTSGRIFYQTTKIDDKSVNFSFDQIGQLNETTNSIISQSNHIIDEWTATATNIQTREYDSTLQNEDQNSLSWNTEAGETLPSTDYPQTSTSLYTDSEIAKSSYYGNPFSASNLWFNADFNNSTVFTTNNDYFPSLSTNETAFISSVFASNETATVATLITSIMPCVQTKATTNNSLIKTYPDNSCPNNNVNEPLFTTWNMSSFGYPILQMITCQSGAVILSCPSNFFLNIFSAYYGIQQNTLTSCSRSNLSLSPSICFRSDSYNTIRTVCQSRNNCFLYADRSYFGDPCVGYNNKQLMVQYQCIDNKTLAKMSNCSSNTGVASICPVLSNLTYQYQRTWCDITKFSIKCTTNQLINILCVVYGIDPNIRTCGLYYTGAPTACNSYDSLAKIKAACNNKNSCAYSSTLALTNICPKSYAATLIVQYECLPNNLKNNSIINCAIENSLTSIETNNSSISIQLSGKCKSNNSSSPFMPNFLTNETQSNYGYQINEQIVCDGSVLNIQCPTLSLIHILNAYYGLQSQTLTQCNNDTSNGPIPANCYSPYSYYEIIKRCENQNQCLITANSASLNIADACQFNSKQLFIQYQCIDSINYNLIVNECKNETSNNASSINVPRICPFTSSQLVNEGVWCDNSLGNGSSMSISCQSNQKIQILCAFYGLDPNVSTCFSSDSQSFTNSSICYFTSSFTQINNLCTGLNSCIISNLAYFFDDSCGIYSNTLYVQWQCDN